MKNTMLLGLVLIGLLFQNCKNNKAEKNTIESQTEEPVVIHVLDTTPVLKASEQKEVIEIVATEAESEEPKTNREKTDVISEPVVQIQKTTKETVTKTSTKVEVKKEIEPEKAKEIIVEKTKEVTPIIKKTVKKETQEQQIIKPVVEKPKPIASNPWVVPIKYLTMKNPIPVKADLAIGKAGFNVLTQQSVVDF